MEAIQPKEASILIIGGGAREHAIGWKIKKDGVADLYFTPGNAGTAQIGRNIEVDWKNFPALLLFIADHLIDLVVIGPEEPLALGLVDFLKEHEVLVVGPTKEAAKLETSKIFARRLMNENQIPQPSYFIARTRQQADDLRVHFKGLPIVLKVDGLAGGKGAFVCHNETDWNIACREIFFEKKFGAAGGQVLVEECLIGEELSVFALCDGKNYRIIGNAQDHKRLGEHDTGPNTGGMGAYSPTPLATSELLQKTEDRIIKPILAAMEKLGCPFTGFLYLGLMLVDNEPYVIEFNVRLGDPEAEVILPRMLDGMFFRLLLLAAQGNLDNLADQAIADDSQYLVAVIKAATGYPDNPRKGDEITGLEQLDNGDLVFQAGTTVQDGRTVTSGGRVLCPIGWGETLKFAINDAYRVASLVHFAGEYERPDIGVRGLGYLENEPSEAVIKT